MVDQGNSDFYEFDGISTRSDDLALAYFSLKRIESLCTTEYGEKKAMLDALSMASALASKAKTGVNAFLSHVSGKEMAEYEKKSLPSEISAVFDAVFDAVFVFDAETELSEESLRRRLMGAGVEASKLTPLTARLESEMSMKLTKAQG